jgi:hypothetical protein
MDQRKKGAKPPLFINNPQGRKTPKEPRMIDTGRQRPRKPPIQCWGCKGDNMFRDCPHRGEKGRVVHNVQQAENSGGHWARNVPRIYPALDNRHAEYQSHMIEVEGMINNQTIAILIDSRASDSYIDPNMVESLHFPRINHGHTCAKDLSSLHNKQAEYQSHMIEVEGMINNQTIVILIDSGASQSYIDPKMVESFHLPRRNHAKSWLV